MSNAIKELIEGLSQPQKMISPKYFYDEIGSQLFEEITELPEYYLTDAELEIMRTYVDEMVELIGEQASLIEFGSGSSLKTRILLGHLDRHLRRSFRGLGATDPARFPGAGRAPGRCGFHAAI